MLPHGGWAADDTTRGVGAEGAARGELEADDSTRVGGRTMRGKWAADDHTTQQEGGAHDVVGGGGDDGNGGGDSGGGGWSSEVGGVPPSMPGTAALAMAPASGGIDDADDTPMAVGDGGGGGGGATTATVKRPPIGLGGGQRRGDRCHGDDHLRDTTLTAPITERDRTMHHWPMVRGRRSGGWVIGNTVFKSFLIGTLRKVVKYTVVHIVVFFSNTGGVFKGLSVPSARQE